MTNNENDEKEMLKYTMKVRIIITAMVTFIITFCLAVFAYDRYLASHQMLVRDYESSGNIEQDLNQLRTVIEENYKGEIDDDKLYQAALKGYVEGLGDEFTTLLSAEELESLNTSLTDFVGIGVYWTEEKNTGRTIILGTVDNDTPAAKAGLKSGDVILEVNLEDVSTKGSDYVSSKVKGKAGTKVKIKVLRGEEKLEFDVERDNIRVYKIKHEMLDNNIGYIDFDSFTDTCDEEFEEAYKDLKNNGAKSLIVDLRDNTGGYVDSALNIADLFLDKGETILITQDNKNREEIDVAKREKIIDIPVVLLVNDYSASASEILTGCLKDHGIAKVVGITTYGKGVIQTLLMNDLGPKIGGALKVTTAEYFTPNRNKINKIGIEPDEVVKLDVPITEAVTKENDNQLKKAIEILGNE